jgi:hypothetical protein
MGQFSVEKWSLRRRRLVGAYTGHSLGETGGVDRLEGIPFRSMFHRMDFFAPSHATSSLAASTLQ